MFKDLDSSKNIRLWIVQTTQTNEYRFVEKFNEEVKSKTLPKKLLFPGVSLEMSLDFLIDYYSP